MQRLLAARNQRQSVLALLSSGAAIFFQFALFLVVGVMLFAFYHVPSSIFWQSRQDLSNLHRQPDAAWNLGIADCGHSGSSHVELERGSEFLSSSSIIDFYLQRHPQIDERRKIRLSRIATFFWALLLFGLAVLSLNKVGRVIEVGLQIASVAYGALLGVFLLGVLTQRANQTGAIVGMVCGFVAELYIWSGHKVPWTWYVAIGTVVTFGWGTLVSVIMERKSS